MYVSNYMISGISSKNIQMEVGIVEIRLGICQHTDTWMFVFYGLYTYKYNLFGNTCQKWTL